MQLVPNLIADPGVVSLLLARPHTFVEMYDHEIFSIIWSFSSLRWLSVSSASMCTENWLTA